MDDLDLLVQQYDDESASTVHHVLRSSRRRLALVLVGQQVIRTRSGSTKSDRNNVEEPIITVRQLAREIVMIEKGVSEDHATGEEYHNVYTSLIQTHLPRLDDVGAVQYDDDRKVLYPEENLLAFVSIVLTTSPLIQLFFHNAIAEHYAGGSSPDDRSTTN